jgi:hypothetical protein
MPSPRSVSLLPPKYSASTEAKLENMPVALIDVIPEPR